ncbi:P-loop containing nucleoside triphosphate hydrolase protein [Naviculisporaceae sp. PSN 640]
MDMSSQIDMLVSQAWEKFQTHDKDERLLVATGGIPGSGKTTITYKVAKALNERYAREHSEILPIAIFVPMDGYHLTRAQLSAMPDPENAHARRGAEFTFDGAGFLGLVQALRKRVTPSTETIFAPSFDHAVKDPKENDIAILPSHRIILFEGNYVLLDKEPWSTAASLMDLRWFVEVDIEVARKRLVARHLAAGIAATIEEADKRAVFNDLVNGEEIIKFRVPVDEVVVSIEEKGWAKELS